MNNSLHKYINSWDIASTSFLNPKSDEAWQDLNEFKMLRKQHAWDFDLGILKERTFDALVITNNQFIIQWVSRGFKNMTGYSREFALNKTPRFLQGPDTVTLKRSEIENVAKSRSPLNAQLKNYRANGQLYTCDIEILPLFNSKDTLSHYLAIEEEVI